MRVPIVRAGWWSVDWWPFRISIQQRVNINVHPTQQHNKHTNKTRQNKKTRWRNKLSSNNPNKLFLTRGRGRLCWEFSNWGCSRTSTHTTHNTQSQLPYMLNVTNMPPYPFVNTDFMLKISLMDHSQNTLTWDMPIELELLTADTLQPVSVSVHVIMVSFQLRALRTMPIDCCTLGLFECKMFFFFFFFFWFCFAFVVVVVVVFCVFRLLCSQRFFT